MHLEALFVETQVNQGRRQSWLRVCFLGICHHGREICAEAVIQLIPLARRNRKPCGLGGVWGLELFNGQEGLRGDRGQQVPRITIGALQGCHALRMVSGLLVGVFTVELADQRITERDVQLLHARRGVREFLRHQGEIGVTALGKTSHGCRGTLQVAIDGINRAEQAGGRLHVRLGRPGVGTVEGGHRSDHRAHELRATVRVGDWGVEARGVCRAH